MASGGRFADHLASVEDLTLLGELTVDNVLLVLKERYKQDFIYTRCGDVLLSVNPFKELPIYDRNHHEKYRADTPRGDLAPHVFQVAATAFYRLQETKKNQVILVSGESGAGKTENTKYMLKHLIEISGHKQEDLHDRILRVNPLLEAFGNARTTLNDNSSRFAKYLQLNFSPDGNITGASIKDYMLEKSRVVHQGRGEGNFHIFYSFLAGLTDSDRDMVSIRRENRFRIVDMNSTVLTQKDADMFRMYVNIMEQLGLTLEEVDNVKGLLATILHLANIDFIEEKKTDMMRVYDEIPLQIVVDLLEIDENVLASALVTKKIKVKGEEIDTVRTKAEAEGVRDALAKALYERLFGWLVSKMNEALCHQNTYHNTGSIGILDICGFECLNVNSFEQMCINLVNEKIQGYMNDLIFKREKEIYESEGLDLMSSISYNNNDGILEMFLARGQILDLIDEDTALKQATDKSLVMKLDKKYKLKEGFRALPGDGLSFKICHFAGEVTYTAHMFLEKNRDTMSPELLDCMKKSKNVMFADLFIVTKGNTGTISETKYDYRASRKRPNTRPPAQYKAMNLTGSIVAGIKQSVKVRFGKVPKGEEDQPRQSQTVIEYFKNSLSDLVKKVDSCEPAFVRCIKPNIKLSADHFDDSYVVNQLRYNGIAEVARIRQKGWPVRRSYSDFLKRFKPLTGTRLADASVTSLKDAAEIILNSAMLQSASYRLGKQMVFMKEETLHRLDTLLAKKKEEERKARELEEKRIEKERQEKERQERERREQNRDACSTIEEETSSFGDQNSSNGSVPYSNSSSDSSPPPYSPNRYGPTTDTPRPSGIPNGRVQTGTASNTPTHTAPSLPPRPSGGKKLEKNFWDIFRVVDTELPRTDAYDQMTFKVVKVITYILLFLLLFASCVGQRLGLMLLVSGLQTEPLEKPKKVSDIEKDRLAHYVFLAIVMCIPYVLTSLWSFIKWLFGSLPSPSFLTWITVFVQEILHSFGLSVLVFWVLPKYDMIFGSLLLTATNIVPNILLIFCASERINGDNSIVTAVKKVFDVLALICQISVVPIVLNLKSFDWSDPLEAKNPNKDGAMVIVAFVCTSVAHWENFVDGKVEPLGTQGLPTIKNYNNILMNKLLKIRYELQEGRYCVSIVSGVLKIAVTSSVLYWTMAERVGMLDLKSTNTGVVNAFDAFGRLYDKPLKFSPLLLVTIGGFVAYCVSYTACRLQMQVVAFSIPLLLCIPVTEGILALDCYYNNSKILDHIAEFSKDCDSGCDFCVYYAFGIAWFLSLLWITRHVWMPRQGRLEEYDSLFMNPFYCGVLLTERLLTNRRRHKEFVCRLEENEDDATKTNERYFIVNPNSSRRELEIARNTETDDDDLPFIYACATMWHETRTEMTQLMKSLFRLDYDRHKREECALLLNSKDTRDRYNFQAHIFFDDALELGEDDRFHPNSFVKTLIDVMNDACSAVHQRYMEVHHPFKVITPYGCQLIWEMPGGCLLYVHVKDKNKIRHRKRWSQVMYMYYLLGYQLLKDTSSFVLENYNNSNHLSKEAISEMFSIDVQRKTKNTYVLALDGDTDFSPGSVRVLLDKMANDKVAAVCGRIHPIGTGPLVWYQMFEYAVGHWLQKATEHVLGCVLCSPGCFSLFRASALMDNNIMKKYTTFPTEPSHFLQYDQGEDRWLCTLLLKQGYRVDYAAAADAYTYAPEGFNEFFNQRRRWTPSTLANILDLLSSSKSTIARNTNISYLYIIYQIAMMFGTVLGPGTVIMMISGAIQTVFDLHLLWSYAVSLVIPAIYVVVCFTTPAKIQLIVGAVFSALYTFIMMSVIAGTVVTAANESIFHPSVIFTCLLFFMFVFAGVLHWREINCLPHCFMYFLCIPSGYLLLFIYSLANLNNVSWGTREVARRKTKKELAAEKKAEALKKKEPKKDGLLARLFFNSSYVREFKNIFESLKPKLLMDKKKENAEMIEILKELNENMAKLAGTTPKTRSGETGSSPSVDESTHVQKDTPEDPTLEEEDEEEDEEDIQETDPYSGPHWANDPQLGTGPVMELCQDEESFWNMFIEKYLKPIDKDEQRENQIKEGLLELRNNVCFAVIMLNALWIALNFMFQLKEAGKVNLPVKSNPKGIDISILGLIFIAFFTTLIIIQFFGMLVHRWETLLHLISMTKLKQSADEEKQLKQSGEKDRLLTRLMGIIEPPADYDDEEEKVISRIQEVVRGGQTGRDLAKSHRLSNTSRRLNDQFQNLRGTLIGNTFVASANGVAGMGLERRNSNMNRNRNNMRVTFKMDTHNETGLRNRYYNPAIRPIMDRIRERTEIEDAPDYDEHIYAEIRQAMPTRMGRDFARNISRHARNRRNEGHVVHFDTPL